MARSRGWAILIGLGCGLLPLAPGQAQGPPGVGLQKPPEVKAELVGGSVTIGRGGSGTFRIVVQVPPRHHGYLDRGDSGWLIPMTFTFAGLEERGAKVSMISGPAGKRGERWRATVLRDKGEFIFRVDAAGVRLPAGAVIPASLRYQICDELTNVCYPPEEIDIPLRFAGAASR